MLSTISYLLLLSPVFGFIIWHLTSVVLPPSIPNNLHNKRIILLIAHPDDESMFFSPTVQALTNPDLGNHVKILCLSTGDSEGLGETRKKELEKAAVTLGLRRKEDVFVMNDPRFRDGMKEEWNDKEIAKVLAQAFAPQLIPSNTSQHARTASGVDLDTKHRRSSSHFDKSIAVTRPKDTPPTPPASPDGPRASIDVLLTFDQDGISSHPNHKALYLGTRTFLRQMMEGHGDCTCPVAFYTLTTINIMRKYSFILDILPTSVVRLCSGLSGKDERPRVNSSNGKEIKGDRPVFVSDIFKYIKAREAMVKGHESQMVWFRWGWISLGRYMVINDLRREYIQS